MNQKIKTQAFLGLAIITNLSVNAFAATTYELTITNGSQMPISPAVVYAKAGGESAAKINEKPTIGFVKLCQTGNNNLRLEELNQDNSVTSANKTMAPVLPGETAVIEIQISAPKAESIHLETMYGKSKDVCGVVSINSHSLVALQQHASLEVVVKDNVVQTGAFLDAEVQTNTNTEFCADQANAVSCLRTLTLPNLGQQRIRNFSGYLPSVASAIESKYGAKETQSLLIPTSGAIQLKVRLKH